MFTSSSRSHFHRFADPGKREKFPVHEEAVEDDAVRAHLLPHLRLAHAVHAREDGDPDLEPRIARLDDTEQKRGRNGDRLDADAAKPSAEVLDLRLPGPRDLPVAEAGCVEKIIEGDPGRPRVAHVRGEPPTGHRRELIGGAPAAYGVLPQLAEQFDDRVPTERIDQLGIEVRGDGEPHDGGRGTAAATAIPAGTGAKSASKTAISTVSPGPKATAQIRARGVPGDS